MAATTRRLLQCVSKTAGARWSYDGLPQSNSKSPPTSSSQRLMELESEFSAHKVKVVKLLINFLIKKMTGVNTVSGNGDRSGKKIHADIDESKVKAPNMFERAKEEFEAVIGAIN